MTANVSLPFKMFLSETRYDGIPWMDYQYIQPHHIIYNYAVVQFLCSIEICRGKTMLFSFTSILSMHRTNIMKSKDDSLFKTHNLILILTIYEIVQGKIN